MVIDRNFSMSGINSGHHNLPTYEMSLKSYNVEFVRYCGGHLENGNRQTFFDVGNQFGISLSTHISNVEDIGQCLIMKIPTTRNFSMSGINSGHHNLPTYEMSLKSDNAEFVRYCGGNFENGDS
jgi:5-carboxymethyl-2-hydroxymuconate isomerase